MPLAPLPAFLRRVYAFRFLNDCVLVYPVYTILFARTGLSVLQISLLLGIWSATTLVVDVPAGVLADRSSRRWLLVVSSVGKAAGFACWLGADGFAPFAAGFVLWGISSSLRSGTFESLVYDTLEQVGHADDYGRVAARAGAAARIGITLACVVGAVVATHSFAPVLMLSIVTMLFCAGVAFGFQDPPRVRRRGPLPSACRAMTGAVAYSARDADVRRILIYTVGALAVYGTLDEYDQLYRAWVGMPLAWFGVWNALLWGGQAAAAAVAHRFEHGARGRVKYVCAAVAGMCLAAAALWPTFALLPVYALPYFAMTVAEVLLDAELQHAIPTEQRATLTSVRSLLMNLSAIGLVLLFGLLSRAGGLRPGLLAFAAILLLGSLPGWRRAPIASRSVDRVTP